MKNYELTYILPANITSEEIKNAFLEVEKRIIKMGGKKLETPLDHPFLTKAEISREEEAEELKKLPMVKRKIAYYIKKNKFGFYCLFNFSSEPEKIKEIEKYLRMNNNVLRHMIVQADPMTKEEIKELEKLFARKRAEQEREKDKIKTKKEEVIEKEKEIEKQPKTKKYEPIKKESAEDLVEKEKSKDTKKEEEEDEGKKKKKMKLEDLEDKLDEILEDTII